MIGMPNSARNGKPTRKPDALLTMNGNLPRESRSLGSFLSANNVNGSSTEIPISSGTSPSSSSSLYSCNLLVNLESLQENNISWDSDGNIASGSLDAMLKQLFPTTIYCPSKELAFTLLLNLRTFISPAEILQKLLQHCLYEQNANLAKNFRRESRWKLFENVFSLLEEWTQQIPYDFRNPAMRDRLLELFGLCQVDPSSTQHLCDDLILELRSTLSKAERYESALRSLQQTIEDPPIQCDHQTGLMNVCPSPVIVAQQLTHIELERLSMIGADEIVDMLSHSSMENLGQIPQNGCPHHKSGRKEIFSSSANIRHYVNWFNQLTALVASEVLRHSRKRHRVKCIEFLIECAKECCNVGNFNSLMAIVAGLSSQPVARLKKTWVRIDKSKLEVLQHQLDPSGNFLSYRATLKAAIWRAEGAKQDAEKLVIPFFGLVIKDLFLIYRNCVQQMPNGHINFPILQQFAQHISDLIKWKNRVCPFKKNNPVLQYLLLGATYSEKNMYLLSYEYEVPETNADKDQYKKLTEDTK
ncbi:rasGEF domain-containing protein [Ditylenchus destructor]|uniref:RasGEF domain-containing protein n=1 Tax=Ditylenchus destructor TaxID=166010 RepID=A0AAD4N8W6_9BILA|nr:rasGEF domain-containing protein [Ditylenchus destructor]